jgi:hypothetical protein
MAYYQVGLATGLGFFRYPLLGGLSVLESITTAGLKGRTFTTNDAVWAFGTGALVPLFLGEGINLVTKGVARQAGVRFSPTIQRSIRAMNQANAEDAARISQYIQEFPKSRMIRSMARYHMSHYIEWNKGQYLTALTKRDAMVSTINTAGVLTAAALADNEYLGLFTLPELISYPRVLIQDR